MAEPILNKEIIKDLQKSFEQLEANVAIAVFTKKGANDQYNDIARQLITEIAEVDSRIKAEFHEIGSETATRHSVNTSPTLLISPEKYRIMFRGAPLGEEGRSLVMALIMASTGQGAISEQSIKKLQKLDSRRLIKVFVSPT